MKNQHTYAIKLEEMAAQLIQKGDFTEGLTILRQCLKIYQNLDRQEDIDVTQNNIAATLLELAKQELTEESFGEAIKLSKEASEIFAQLGQTRSEVVAKQILADTYYRMGIMTYAMELYEFVLNYVNQTDDDLGIATTRNKIANLLRETNNNEQALFFYKAAFEVYLKIGEVTGISQTRDAIVSLLSEKQDMDDIRTIYVRSIDAYKKLGNKNAEMGAIFSLATYLQTQNMYKEASEYFKQIMIYYQEIGFHLEAANCQVKLAECDVKLGDMVSAQHNYRESIKIYNRLGIMHSRAIAQAQLGQLLFLSGQYDEALQELKEAFSIIDTTGYKEERDYVKQLLVTIEKQIG